jgi:SET domain-containing protein
MKFKIVQVTVREGSSVTKYMRESASKKDMVELFKGVRDRDSWSIETDKNNHVVSAHPEVPGHHGHVDGRNWKIYVERGKKTKDRLILSNRQCTVVPKGPDLCHVSIKCAADVQTDTH